MVGAHSIWLQNVGGVHDAAKIFDQLHLFLQDLYVLVDQPTDQWGPLVVTHMGYATLLDLGPTLVLSGKEFLVRQRVHFWTVEHLPVDQTHHLQGD